MRRTLKRRPLGKTKLEVSEVGLGTVFLSTKHTTERDEAIRVAHRALELGVNYIDTAPLYGNAQEIVGEALEGRNEQYLLGTKCWRWHYKTGAYRTWGRPPEKAKNFTNSHGYRWENGENRWHSSEKCNSPLTGRCARVSEVINEDETTD